MSRTLAVVLAVVLVTLGATACGVLPTAEAKSASTKIADAKPASATHRLFGLYVYNSPDNPTALAHAEDLAGCRAGITEYFEDARDPLSYRRMDAAAAGGSIPMISLEMWKWKLADISAGRYDKQLIQQAHQLSLYNGGKGGTIYIRMDHEMNGQWYPWSEDHGGNALGSYAAAWRHVVTLIRKTGTGRTTVKWVWAPGVLRGTRPNAMISAYPGDAYVDVLGVTGYGYGTYEHTVGHTFDATIAFFRKNINATKPIMVTESGASPGKYKVSWASSLGAWLNANPSVIAFTWFDFTKSQGANEDWRFTPYPKVAAGLAASLRTAAHLSC